MTSARLACTRRYDVCVAGHVGPSPVAWALRRLGLIRSYVVVLHGIEAWRPIRGLDGRAVEQATCVVATTRYTADEFLRQHRVPESRIRVIPLSLAETSISPPSWHTSEGLLRVLTVARLSVSDRVKGIDTTIRAIADARAAGSQVELTIVGDGNDMDYLRREAAHAGAGAVRFAGAVSGDLLERFYRECDVFVMPSRKEGFGLVFLEAMRHGRPCIGGRHGGIPEVIAEGSDGFLVDGEDVAGLAALLQRLAKDRDLLHNLGANAYRKVAAQHLYPRMRDDWVALLREVTSTAAGGDRARRG